MFTPKENAFDRIEQTFVILKNNFFQLFLPIFVYNLISIIVFGVFIISTFTLVISKLAANEFDLFTLLNNSSIVLYIAFGMVFSIIFGLLYIPVLITSIKSIKQACNEEKITIKENLIFGFSRLFSSFRTYWYMFAYVALIPALLFIIGGILFNVGYFVDGQSYLKGIAGFILGFSTVLFMIFLIYRGLKTIFSIYLAVDNDEYTKATFDKSVSITDNNWGRIAGNFILIGLITGLISTLISGFIPSFFNFSKLSEIQNINDITNLFEYFSLNSYIISSIFNNIINTISSIFLIIFIYIFYKRLEFEFTNNKENITENKEKILEKNNIEL